MMIKLNNHIYRVLIAAIVIGSVTGCGQQQHEFRLLMPALPRDQDIASELVEVFQESSSHNIVLVPVPDSAETALDALESGYADLAFASNAQPYRQGVTAVMPLYPTVLHIFYRRGRDTGDPRALLQGASVWAGPVGSASRQLMTTILKGLDMTEADVTFVGGPDEIPDIIVLYLTIAPDRVHARLKDFGAEHEYHMLSFGAPNDIGTGSPIDRTILLNPRLSPFVVPVGTYGDINPDPVVTLAVDKLLVASHDLDSAAVYDLISEIRRLQPALAAAQPMLFQNLSDDFDASGLTFVLHPGAQAFTQRDAPDFVERYSGVAEVLVTLVIGLISGSYAIAQIYHRRRKNRIDTFYTDVIALRDSITDDSSMSDRETAVREVKALQTKAFAALVDEKLAADESFRIFVTLSNDIIAELGSTTR
jgi:hypothetical protein